MTPLHIASEIDNADVVAVLVQAKADVDMNDNSGLRGTPLYTAAEMGQLETVETLLQQRANVNKPSAEEGIAPLYIAIMEDHGNVVPALVQAKANVNQPIPDDAGGDGWRPLHIAAHNSDIDVVRFLLQHRADTNAVASTGDTALQVAAQSTSRQGPTVHALMQYFQLPRWQQKEHRQFPADLRRQTAAAVIALDHYVSRESAVIMSQVTEAMDAHARNRTFEMRAT